MDRELEQRAQRAKAELAEREASAASQSRFDGGSAKEKREMALQIEKLQERLKDMQAQLEKLKESRRSESKKRDD